MGDWPERSKSHPAPPQGGRGEQAASQVTIRHAFVRAARALKEAGIETPELDARLLLCHAAGLTHEGFVARAADALPADAQARIEQALVRRRAGEPVSRIVGAREFYGRAFLVGPDTLDPRPDTETLIDAALALVTQNGWRGRALDILDLGTGTGCILITLLAELPEARGIGTDISSGALAVAAENARRHGVAGRAAFIGTDWLAGIEGQFDLIVSNPPYLAVSEMAAIATEVAHDPRAALDGGADGLDAYRRIVASARTRLRDGGALLLEIGASQAEPVARILTEAGFEPAGPVVRRDLAGRPRCIVARASQPARVKGREARKFGLENGDVQVRFGPTTDISRPSALARARPVATATRADFS